MASLSDRIYDNPTLVFKCIAFHYFRNKSVPSDYLFSGFYLKFPLGSSIKYVRNIFRKTNICNALIRTRTCAYQGVRNISFSENFAYVLNGSPPFTMCRQKFSEYKKEMIWFDQERSRNQKLFLKIRNL